MKVEAGSGDVTAFVAVTNDDGVEMARVVVTGADKNVRGVPTIEVHLLGERRRRMIARVDVESSLVQPGRWTF